MKNKKRSPISYIGGKFYMSKHIIPLLRYDVDCYIEPFFGAGQVFFKKEPHKVEIINDIDNDLINFYKVWRDYKDEFVSYLDKIPFSRSQYELWINEWKNGNKGKDDFDRAVRFFYMLRSSFSGIFGNGWAYSYTKASSYYYNSLDLLNHMHSRIKNAMIENKDYKKLLLNLPKDRKVMLYLDPPYYGVEYYYKDNTFDAGEHRRLAEIVNNLDDNKYVILSYYYFDGIEDLYPKDKWKYIEVEQTKCSKGITNNSKSKEKPKSIELIIMNYKV